MRSGSTSARERKYTPAPCTSLILAAAGSAIAQRFAEIQAVADAAAVIHRQHHEAAVGEVLVHRVGVHVVIHGMPAEQHLAPRAAVKEDHRGRAAAGFPVRRQKKLSVDGEAVGARENHLLRRHHPANREIGRDGFGMQVADGGAEANGGAGGVLGIGAEKRERAIGGRRGCPFEAVAMGDRFRRAARSGHLPEMAAVDIALIGIENNLAAVGGEGNLLHFKRAGREQERSPPAAGME